MSRSWRVGSNVQAEPGDHAALNKHLTCLVAGLGFELAVRATVDNRRNDSEVRITGDRAILSL